MPDLSLAGEGPAYDTYPGPTVTVPSSLEMSVRGWPAAVVKQRPALKLKGVLLMYELALTA
jgi:hypothetical protein